MNEIISLTKTLIQFPSVHSRPEAIHDCADFIGTFLAESGIRYERIDHEGTPSILVMPEERRSQILLMAHFDVVEGSDDLFHPYEKNGFLFGRGSLDDKYAVALSLILLKTMVSHYREKNLGQEDIPLGILLTGDEENGGENGAKKVLASIKTDFCIVLDGGSINEIITKEKGIAQVKLVATGKSAHGSRPWLGKNAIETLFKDYQTISEQFDNTNSDNWHRTVNLAKIEAGSSYNQVPGRAEAILDIRYTETDDINSLLTSMRSSITSDLILLRKEPLFVAKPSPYLDLLLKSNPEITTTAEHGSSDARYLSEYDINGIVWGACGNLSHHSDKEHISLKNIEQLYLKLTDFIKKASRMNR